MTSPYPSPPRRLERSATDKIVGGVCGGVAQYLNMDPTLVRIVTAVLTLVTGVPIVVYVVALFVMPVAKPVLAAWEPPGATPEEPTGPTAEHPQG